MFPLREAAATSHAECAYAVVDRGLEAEGGPSEKALPTYPSRRFVQAGGITIAHEGLLEYELVDIEAGAAHSLAITLLRATGMLSRLTMLNRPLPAGPTDKLEGPQMIGRLQVRYVIAVGEMDPYALVDDAFLPLPVVTGFGGGARTPEGTELTVEIRVFNPRDVASAFSVARAGTPARGHLVDLRGRATGSFEGSTELAPFKIATLRLSPKAP